MKRALQKSEPVWHGLLRLVQTDWTMVGQLATATGADTDRVIHQLRLTTKRLRATWRLLRPHMDQARVSLENARLREAAHALATHRDRTVALATFRGLMDDADVTQRRVLQCCIRHLDQRTSPRPSNTPSMPTDWAGVSSHLTPVAMALGVLRESVQSLCRHPMPRMGGWELLEPGLRQTYTRARQGWRKARCAQSLKCAEEESLFHDWRRDVKRLFYQLEPLHLAWPRQLKPMTRQLAKLGEQLGDYHDLQVVQTLLNHDPILSQLPGQATIQPLLSHRQHRLCERSLRRARRCLRAKPKVWMAELQDHFLHWYQAPQGIV